MKTLLMAALLGASAMAHAAGPLVEVWKSPSCGCCGDWVQHLKDNGFTVKVTETEEVSVWREKLGMPERYGSCHSAKVGAYALEGHVPASEVKRLLREKPKAVGLAVPGMPLGSPGMDGAAYQGRKHTYDVLLVQRDGASKSYQHYKGNTP